MTVSKKEISETSKTEKAEVAIQQSQLPLDLGDFKEFAGAGLEEVTAKDINIPFINFLQSGSPQTKKGNEKRINGAEEGDIVVTGINKLYKVDDTGNSQLNVSIVQKITLLTEWAPNRGGLQGYHSMAKKDALGIKKAKNAEGKDILVLPNGNEIQETDYLFCIASTANKEDAPFFCLMAMAQTKRSSVRTLFTQLMFDCQGVLPTFAFVYTLGTVVKTKDDWSWVVPKFTKITSDDGVAFVNNRGILNRKDPHGNQIFNSCVSFFKAIKEVGIENFLSRTNDEYDEVDTSYSNTAAEII